MPIPTLWALAQAWYGNRLSPDWRPRTAAASQRLLAGVGLVDEFWQLVAEPQARPFGPAGAGSP